MANSENGKSTFKVTDNTVCAVGQMRNSSKVYFLGNPEAKRRLLIVRNSITRHGPLAEIGWEKDWGMAASAPERDYVHVLDDYHGLLYKPIVCDAPASVTHYFGPGIHYPRQINLKTGDRVRARRPFWFEWKMCRLGASTAPFFVQGRKRIYKGEIK